MKNKSVRLDNELIFVFYLFSFTLLKPITTIFSSYSTLILLVITNLLIVTSLFKNKFKLKKLIIYILIFSFIWFSLEITLRFNGQTLNYIKDFYIYGLSTMYFLSKVEDFDRVLNYFVLLGFLSYIVMFVDPFIGYAMSETYMVFGFSVLPSFTAILIGFLFLGIKSFSVISLLAFIQLLVYANRGTILSAIVITVFFYFYNLLMKEITLKTLIREAIKGSFITLGIFALIRNLTSIIETIYLFLLEKNFNSYSLYSLTRFLNSRDISNEMSPRTAIHNSAWEIIKDNSVFGAGLGWFHDYYGIYSHNIGLDFLLSFGIIGTVIVLIVILRSVVNFRLYSDSMKIFYLSVLFITAIPLWFSIHFNVSKTFWIIIYIGLTSKKIYEKGLCNEEKYEEKIV